MTAHDGAKTPAELLALVDQVEQAGGWLVLFFHGVGADHLAVTLEAHCALLDRLLQRRDRLWTAPFGTVAQHVKWMRERPAP